METKVRTAPNKMPGRTKGALWLLITPTTLIVVGFLLFAVANLIFNPTMWPTPDTESFAPTPPIVTIVNVLLFTITTIGVITWLPALITGIVLLSTKKK